MVDNASLHGSHAQVLFKLRGEGIEESLTAASHGGWTVLLFAHGDLSVNTAEGKDPGAELMPESTWARLSCHPPASSTVGQDARDAEALGSSTLFPEKELSFPKAT